MLAIDMILNVFKKFSIGLNSFLPIVIFIYKKLHYIIIENKQNDLSHINRITIYIIIPVCIYVQFLCSKINKKIYLFKKLNFS